MIRALVVVSGRMFGGGQRVVCDLAEESKNWTEGSVNVCLLGGPVAALQPLKAAVIEYDGRYNSPATLLTSSRSLRKVIETTRPDLLHSHGWDAAMIGALALVGSPILHLVHLHTTDVWLQSGKLEHRLRRMLTSWMFKRRGTSAVAVSEAVRLHWYRALGELRKSVRVVHNGVNLERYQPASARNERCVPRIGVAARLQPNKGLEDLFEALVMLAKDNLHPVLLIAGQGGFRPVLENRVDQLGLRTQVRFLGFVHEMEKFYRSISIGVLPARSGEGLPLAVMEAMACGVPVVATDVGGTSEVLRDGIDGFVVPGCNPSALATALGRLYRDLGERQRMGANASRRIAGHFSNTVAFGRISELYRTMLRQREGNQYA